MKELFSPARLVNDKEPLLDGEVACNFSSFNFIVRLDDTVGGGGNRFDISKKSCVICDFLAYYKKDNKFILAEFKEDADKQHAVTQLISGKLLVDFLVHANSIQRSSRPKYVGLVVGIKSKVFNTKGKTIPPLHARNPFPIFKVWNQININPNVINLWLRSNGLS